MPPTKDVEIKPTHEGEKTKFEVEGKPVEEMTADQRRLIDEQERLNDETVKAAKDRRQSEQDFLNRTGLDRARDAEALRLGLEMLSDRERGEVKKATRIQVGYESLGELREHVKELERVVYGLLERSPEPERPKRKTVAEANADPVNPVNAGTEGFAVRQAQTEIPTDQDLAPLSETDPDRVIPLSTSAENLEHDDEPKKAKKR